jgi:hypothetical protein
MSPYMYFNGMYPLFVMFIYRIFMYKHIYGCNYVFPSNYVLIIYVCDMYIRIQTLYYIDFDKRFIFVDLLILFYYNYVFVLAYLSRERLCKSNFFIQLTLCFICNFLYLRIRCGCFQRFGFEPKWGYLHSISLWSRGWVFAVLYI